MASKPRLLAFTTSYLPDLGGVEVALQQVAERLAREFDISIVTARLRRRRPRFERRKEGSLTRLGLGLPVDKWLLPPWTLLRRMHLVGQRGDQNGPLLWGLDITQASLAAVWLRRLERSLPLVLTIQYGEGADRVASGRLGLIRRAFLAMLSQADRVTAISRPLAEMARAYGYSRPVSIIPNGVDLERYRRPFARPSGAPPTVVTVSRLVRKNGLDVLLRSLKELRSEDASLQCHVVGDGPEGPALRQLAAELGLERVVRFFGSVPHEMIAQHLWQSDVFVRPSRSEGMGNAFVEAMAAGVPVIGTSVGGLTDIIQDGKTGLVVSVDDPGGLAQRIRRLLNDRAFASWLAGEALEIVRERYDIDAVARRYAQVFRESLSR